MFHNMLKNKNERYSKITNKITIARLGKCNCYKIKYRWDDYSNLSRKIVSMYLNI